MNRTDWLCLDLSTAPILDAAHYLEGAVKAPSNYGPDAAEKYIREKSAERLQMAATDVDLARITGVARISSADHLPMVDVDTGGDNEAAIIRAAIDAVRDTVSVITFGGFAFDLPILMRRARYLGLSCPTFNLDRYRSPHVDLCEVLSDRNPQRRRSLLFYAKRLGWDDIQKPLSGADEARVPETGQWDALAASLRHDVTATYRLARWLGLIRPLGIAAAEVAL